MNYEKWPDEAKEEVKRRAECEHEYRIYTGERKMKLGLFCSSSPDLICIKCGKLIFVDGS